MMERRPWTLRTGRLPPKRYRDIFPEPPVSPALTLPVPLVTSAASASASHAKDRNNHTIVAGIRSIGNHIRGTFTTQRNKFGYFDNTTQKAPHHTISGLVLERRSTKVEASFKDLVNIVGDPEFSPADIRDTKWDHINQVLASDGEWINKDVGGREVMWKGSEWMRKGVSEGPLLFHRTEVGLLSRKSPTNLINSGFL
jgi:hypothetical protein